MTMRYFWAQNGSFAPNVFWKIINIILIYLLALSLCKILKKFFQRIQSYEDAQFLGPKWPISPNEFMPIFMPKSKSDINLLVKY